MAVIALFNLAMVIHTKDQKYLRGLAIAGWIYAFIGAILAALAISQGGW